MFSNIKMILEGSLPLKKEKDKKRQLIISQKEEKPQRRKRRPARLAPTDPNMLCSSTIFCPVSHKRGSCG
jgi:hypothetical protein